MNNADTTTGCPLQNTTQLYNNRLTGTLPQNWGQANLSTLGFSPPPPRPPPLPPLPPVSSGLVLYLPGDGSAANFSSSSAGVTWQGALSYTASGVLGQALQFNNAAAPGLSSVPVNVFINALAASGVASTTASPYTVAAWINPAAASVGLYQTALSLFSGTYPILAASTAGYTAGTGGAFMLQFNPTYGLNTVTALVVANPVQTLQFTPSASLCGAWNHYAVTVRRPGGSSQR